jgi:hypothetical protein
VDLNNNKYIIFWRYHNIGTGMKSTINSSNLDIRLKYDILYDFPDRFPIGRTGVPKTSKKLGQQFYCPEVDCNIAFTDLAELKKHLSDGNHERIDGKCTSDTIKKQIVKKFKTESQTINIYQRPAADLGITNSKSKCNHYP